MNGSQKLENLLNLSLEASPTERQQSQILNVGVNESDNTWEVIIRYHGDADVIRALPGTRVETLLGGYAIVWVPEEQISALAARDEVEYVEKPKELLYQVENGRAVSCIDILQRGETSDLTGQGVLIAILDSGIDYTLPEFRKADGSSRIRYLWDQTLDREFTKEEIDEALQLPGRAGADNLTSGSGNNGSRSVVSYSPYDLVPSRDLSGHGTAVAAVAAGNSVSYRGVATESELLVVKLGTAGARSFPRTTQLMRGLDYVLRKALELGRPVAVNISIGNNYGSHDGSSLLETFIDTAAGFSPNVIVIGSGNEGTGAGHFSGRLTQPVPGMDGPERARQIARMSVGVYETGLTVQLWKSYVDEFDVELVSPTGQVLGPFSEGQGPGRYRVGGAQVLVYYGEPKPFSQSQEILLDFLPEDTYLDSGIWELRLTPRQIVEGSYDLWLPGASVLNRGTQFLRQSPQVTLTIPSTAAKAITVGAYDGRRQAYADFSGRGFLRNLDRVKPDLAAPGVDIRVPLVGGGYGRQSGTSFATPFVTGAAALLMEWGMVRGNDPYLYGEKVKAYLIRGARPLGSIGLTSGEYPNERVGYGALCVAESLPG